MNDYFTGAVLQLLARAGHLNTRVPRDLAREFHTLVAACQAEVSRISGNLRFLIDEPAMRLPANQPERLRMLRRAVADLDLVETVGFAAIERAHREDLRLNTLMDRIRLEIAYPLLPPVVTSLSRAYFGIFPSLNLLCVPLTEGRFLLHLPDLYHEIAHPLLRVANNPLVDPFRAAHDRVMRAALGYLDEELRAQERRRGPAQMVHTLECWVRSWVSWSIEFLCDLFGTLTVGAAFAWSHLHLAIKRGGDPFAVPSYAPTSHPPDGARMAVMLNVLTRMGFAAEVARIEERWQSFTALVGGQPEPEYRRCFPQTLLAEVCRAAQDGVAGMGCRIASPSSREEVHTTLNQAWEEFWRDPAGYGAWEERAVAKLFSPAGRG
ncbi:MAG: hypothetical protein C0467_27825 [Planctomycetaceae bacterium]|nr:hypothetical protein [Planctomycetaceae bacterium]